LLTLQVILPVLSPGLKFLNYGYTTQSRFAKGTEAAFISGNGIPQNHFLLPLLSY
jgi:hypothetical protein